MAGLRQYVLSIITVALICSILSRMVTQEITRNFLQLLCGVVLLFVMAAPVLDMELPSLGEISLPGQYSASSAVEEGRELADEAAYDIIKSSCEAYILDKAVALGADIHVSISLNSERSPWAARITGVYSPEMKKHLEQVLETDLGIAKENQSWTG